MMPTDTLERADVADLTELEFETICDIKWALIINGDIVSERPCELPAKWVGNYPCCGKLVVLCDLHKDHPDTTFMCMVCKRKFCTHKLVSLRPL